MNSLPTPPTNLAPDSSALMVRVAAGDKIAFAALARRLWAPALRLADRTLGERAGAEDVVQVALTRLWTEAQRFDPARGSVEGWFRRIVINLCLDGRRRLRPAVPIEEMLDLASTAPDPEQAALASDDRARLEAAMARLAPRQRAALAMFHGEGLSMAEIAVLLETTPKAIEGLLGRARMEIRTILKDPEAA